MKKTKLIILCTFLCFLILLTFYGISDYVKSKDSIDLFITAVLLTLIYFFGKSSLKCLKKIRDDQERIEISTHREDIILTTQPTREREEVNAEIQRFPPYDSMGGHEFEHYCAEIIRKNNFENAEVTQGSGDHGIDILAEKDGITYAIQCKCYSSNIGNAAVQQAHTGKSIYKKDIAVVLTNRYFTAQAKEEAEALGVKLWDRDKLNNMIEKANC